MTCTVPKHRVAPAAHAAAFSVAHGTYCLQDANFNVTALVTRLTLIGDGGIQNGSVDIVDLAIVANHFGLIVTGGAVNGDFNHDGIVDIVDLAIVSNHWQLIEQRTGVTVATGEFLHNDTPSAPYL